MMGCQRYVKHCRDWQLDSISTDPFFVAFRSSDKRSGDLARGLLPISGDNLSFIAQC